MTTTGTDKHTRLAIALTKGGTKLARRLFETRVRQLTPTGHTHSPWTVDEFLNSNKGNILSNETGRRKERTYFPGVLDKTDLSQWDLSMFCYVLYETCDLDPVTKMDVFDLRKLRNKLSHLSEPSLGDTKYCIYMTKLENSFKRTLKTIGDAHFEEEIIDILRSAKDDPLSLFDTLQEMHKFYRMEEEVREVLSEHTKNQKAMLDKLDLVIEQTKIDENAIEFPVTDVIIKVRNCNTEKEKRLSEWLQRLIDENINKETKLSDEMSNESFHKLREAVDKAVKTFLSNGRPITSAESKCVLLRVRCMSLKHLVKLFRDYVSGQIYQDLRPLEASLNEITGFEEITLDVTIYEDEFWKVMDKTVSAVEDYVSSSRSSKKTIVRVERTQFGSDRCHAVKLSIPTGSDGHLEKLRESFESGRVTENMNEIQKAASMDLNFLNVSIEANLLEQASTTGQVCDEIEQRYAASKPKKKTSKGKKKKYFKPFACVAIKPRFAAESSVNTKIEKEQILNLPQAKTFQAQTEMSRMKVFGTNQENLSGVDEEGNTHVTNEQGAEMKTILELSATGQSRVDLISCQDNISKEKSDGLFSRAFSDGASRPDSGLGADITSSSFSYSQSSIENVTNHSDDASSDPSFGTDEETDFSEEKPDIQSEDIAIHSDENLIQHGVKLNKSFMAKFRSKTSKYPAYYQKFKDSEELKQLVALNPCLYVPCTIHLEGSHEAYCTPNCKTAEESFSRIHISGRTKIGQAYNGDEVVVELLDNRNKKDKRYGKVLGVLRRHSCPNENIDHPVFLCTSDDAESHILRPMCKTVPKIHVLHDAILERYKKAMRFKVEIYEYDERAEILSNPRIETLSHAEINSSVFLVAIISWELNQIYPRGAIIKRFPCGDTIASGLAILDLRYEVTKMFSSDTIKELTVKPVWNEDLTVGMDDECMKDKTNLRTFTIDRCDVNDFNYAFSLEKVENGCKVGVHISDVSLYIKKDSPIDKDAFKRSLTIHSGIDTPRYMLPAQISLQTCSLLKKETRPVISIYLFFSNDGRQLQTTKQNFLIEMSLIRCCENLSYEQAQLIVKNGHEDVDGAYDIELKKDLMFLFRMMLSARKLRLGRSMYFISESEIRTEEWRRETIEAQCVAEELVIRVNKKVAELMSRQAIAIPVYTQQAPATKDLETFCQKYETYLDILVHFQNRQITPFKKPMLENALLAGEQQKVMVTRNVWEMIKTSVRPELFIDDSLHPLQSVIYSQWLSLQNVSCYRCSSADVEQTKHFSHGLDIYTHCTTPTRRYTDVVVQRMLHFYLKRHERQVPYSDREINEICAHVNYVAENAIGYQRDCISLQRGVELKSKMKMENCFVSDVSDKSIEVIDQSKALIKTPEAEVSFSLLDMGYKPVLTEDKVSKLEGVSCTWRKRLYNIRRQEAASSTKETGKENTCSEYVDGRKDYVQSLNPYRDIKFIKIHQWARLIKNAADDHQKDLKRNISQAEAHTEKKGLADVSTECLDSSRIQANTKFSLLFHIGKPLNVQMYAKPRQGILVPKPMLMEMTDNVKLCLQHTDDPVLHLSKYSTDPTLDQYQNSQKYAKTWLPIVLMEAALNAVCNEEGCIIKNVCLKIENEYQGVFMLPVEFCDERNIELSGNPSRNADEEMHSFDWLCIKCKGYSTLSQRDKWFSEVWIGHAEVTDINIRQEDTYGITEEMFAISFTLHENTEKFGEEVIGTKKYIYDIEILKKCEVDRRIESYLRVLPQEEDALAVKIALKRKLKPLDKDHAHYSNKIKRDLYILTTSADPKSKPLPKNNRNQQKAIDLALRNRFTLIQGPPGTGKTYTGIKLIYLFNKINDFLSKEGKPRYQVLFCGPSNKSVDLVARWMLYRLGNYCPKFVRIYGRATEAEDFPIPGISYQSKGNKIHKADEDLQPIALHYLIRKNGSDISRKIKSMDIEFQKMIRRNKKPDAITLKSYLKLLAKASIDEIKKHHVILCTTGFGSNPKLLKAAKVYQVIVDEAGMCPEPQCMVPLIATKAEQIVLIGDHKQLRPIVKCKEAAQLGLEKSLFERHATTKESIARFIMLDEQYRMHPNICDFPSQQFYKGQLRTRDGLWKDERRNFWPTDQAGQEEYPHILIHVEGEETILTVNTDDGNEQSRSNSGEIDQVVKVYRFLTDENISPSTINVISQYNAQCSEMKDALKKQGFTKYLVNTVVSSQGGEWDFVIFSTVRSLPQYKIETNSTIGWRKHNLGFITDSNQINVALTRARKGLIIIGNKNLLCCDPVWKKLVSHYEQRKCVKSPDEFPPKRTRQQKMYEAQTRSTQRYGNTSYGQGKYNRPQYESMGAIPKIGPRYTTTSMMEINETNLLQTDNLSLNDNEWPLLQPGNAKHSSKKATSFQLQGQLSTSESSVECQEADSGIDSSVEADQWNIVRRKKKLH